MLGGCDGYFISSNTKNPEASINILKYLTSKEAFELQVDDGDVVPANVEEEPTRNLPTTRQGLSEGDHGDFCRDERLHRIIISVQNYFYDKEGTLEELESLRTSAQ